MVIDICQWIISLAGQTPALTGSEAVEKCIQMGVLSSSPAYNKMVQFRNFIVHRYDYINAPVLIEVVNNHLQDFEQFKKEVLHYVQDQVGRD